MSWSLTAVAYIYIQTALIAGAVAFFAWRRRATPGAAALAGLMAAAMLWATMEAVENAAPTLEAKIMASKISHIGIQTLPVFFLLFVMRYTGGAPGDSRRRLHWLWVIPALAVLAAFTNERHLLFWRQVELTASPFGGVESVYHHGPLFWVAAAYLYVLNVIATSLLMNTLLTQHGVYRRQALVLLAAAAAPWLANALYLSGANPIPGFDWTPVAFAITGLLLGVAIFRIGLLELRPVACQALFEQMRDPLLVLDLQQRIVDANPAARSFFGAHRAMVGRLVTELLPAGLCQNLANQGAELVTTLYVDDRAHQFDVSVSPLSGVQPGLEGSLIVLRETTDRMMLEETLRQSEQRYRRLIDDAPFPSLVSSVVDGAVLYANRRAQELLALAPGSAGALRFDDYFAVQSACADFLASLRQQGVVSDFEA